MPSRCGSRVSTPATTPVLRSRSPIVQAMMQESGITSLVATLEALPVARGVKQSAMPQSAPKSKRRAISVEAVAAATGAPARASKPMRMTSPTLVGNRWFANSAICNMTNNLLVGTGWANSVRQAMARSANALV